MLYKVSFYPTWYYNYKSMIVVKCNHYKKRSDFMLILVTETLYGTWALPLIMAT